eukprot:gnl/MRDRNA2_/MRDRNA2_108148_c0_seq1.p1 gnl/MRDRNA2_/MRDRNA2_108148_c0~~gnl/MRDRNA2_/MRDRNA2_108148_c0_seq1.p1  ORF type:complete len:421 (-),score=92.15 gnl/MRDRNA2_/MRDRNA2_108148_c0_seq1:16-1278(-)
MADILAGNSGHASFAPLSHAQTIHVCQHLQAQIHDLQKELTDVRCEVRVQGENIRTHHAGIEETGSFVNSLREGLNHTNQFVDSLQNDLGNLRTSHQRLNQEHDSTGDQVKRLEAGQALLTTQYTEVKNRLATTNAEVTGIHKQLDGSTSNGMTALKHQIQEASLRLKRFEEEHTGMKTAMQEQKDALRAEESKLQAECDSLAKTNAVVQMLEQRLTETQRSLKATRHNLEEANRVVVKVHEDHDNTKAILADCCEGLKRTNLHVKQVHEGLDTNVRNLANTQVKLEEASTKLDKAKTQLDQTSLNVKSLREGQDMVKETTRAMQANLENTHCSLKEVKQGLRETNAIVLPNLMSNGAHVKALVPHSGDNQQQVEEHFQKAPSSPAPPIQLKSKSPTGGKAEWTRKYNLSGTAPNRAAWI